MAEKVLILPAFELVNFLSRVIWPRMAELILVYCYCFVLSELCTTSPREYSLYMCKLLTYYCGWVMLPSWKPLSEVTPIV